jgi:hypothetical protein
MTGENTPHHVVAAHWRRQTEDGGYSARREVRIFGPGPTPCPANLRFGDVAASFEFSSKTGTYWELL